MGPLAHALPPRRAAQHREADREVTSSGGSAADVTPSAATGAAVEPVRENRRLSARRHRAWRAIDVTIWPACSTRVRSVVSEVPVSSSSAHVHTQREGKSARPPGSGTGRLGFELQRVPRLRCLRHFLCPCLNSSTQQGTWVSGGKLTPTVARPGACSRVMICHGVWRLRRHAPISPH